jgi:hypothetical protein
MRTARAVLTPLLRRKTMISRTIFWSAQALAMLLADAAHLVQTVGFGLDHRLGLELLDQAADVVAIARQLRFEIVDLAGQNGLDDAGVDRLDSHLEPGLEGPHQVLADL